MELSDNFKKATALKEELDNLRPLSPGQEKKDNAIIHKRRN